MIGLPHGFRAALVALAFASLAACASVPYVKDGSLPAPVTPADGSAERAALNAQVYDAAVGYVERLFYKRDFGGVDFRGEARARRAAALARPDSDGFYAELDMLLELLDDDHTATLSPVEREMVRAREQGEARAGFGFVVTPRGDERFVALVNPDTPAAEAGVLPGWRIESVAGRPALLAPPPVLGRTDGVVFVDEDGGKRAFDLTAVLTPPRARFETRSLEGDVAYIRFDDFDRPRYDAFEAEMKRLATTPPAGLIIDLRTNGGGSFDLTGLMLAFLFPDEQEFAIVEGRFIDRRFTAAVPDTPYTGPVVILTGPGTASAAELMAGTAQEKGRVVVVGDTTRGAVTGTRGINLPDGGLLRVGMIVMTTPSGRSLEKVGVTPDIVVPDDWRAVRDGRDPVLEAALAALRDRRAPSLSDRTN